MKMKNIIGKVKKKYLINLTVLALMILVSVWYAYKIGLLFCGYFFADDHEIARLHGGIVRDGLWTTMQMWLEADTNLRFRPVYWIFRVMESYICGTHVVLWHLIKACEIGFCAWAAFVFARKMKASYLVSVIFGVVGFFGTQCAIVYRLGPQEPLALIWLFLGLICAVKYIEGSHKDNTGQENTIADRKRRWLVGFHIFMTLMMLTKESFLILVPICVFFFLYLELQNIYVGDEKLRTAIGRTLKKHVGTIIYEAVVFIICMCVIVFHSGVSSTGYAGLDASYTIRDYLVGMWNIWKGELKSYLLLMFVVIAINAVLSVKYRKQKGFAFYRLCELLIVLYFVLSQSLLHAKTGMSERYLFPCITGILIYVCCFGIPLWVKLLKERSSSPELELAKAKRGWKMFVPQAALAVWAIWMIVGSQFHALCLNYVFTCSNNTRMLIRLSELAYENGGEDCKIIVSTQFGEWNLALCAFMEELYGVDQTFALSQSDPYNDIALDRYVIGNEPAQTLTIPEADIYVAQKEFLPIKMQDYGMDYSQMQQEVFGNYIIYVK